MTKPMMVGAVLVVLGVSACAGAAPEDARAPASYCNRPVGDQTEPSCYPTERERAAAWARLQTVQVDPEQKQLDALVAGQRARDRERAERAEQEAEEDRKQAERERDRERAEKFERERERVSTLSRMARDPAYAVPAISAIMCDAEESLAGWRKDLARENRIAQIGGSEDLRRRHQAGSGIVDDTEDLNDWRAALHRFGAVRVPCAQVEGVLACRREGRCNDSSRDLADVWAQEIDTLRGKPSRPPEMR